MRAEITSVLALFAPFCVSSLMALVSENEVASCVFCAPLFSPGLAGLCAFDVELDRLPVGRIGELEAVEREVAEPPGGGDDPLRPRAGQVDLFAPDVGPAQEDGERRFARNRLGLGGGRLDRQHGQTAPERRYSSSACGPSVARSRHARASGGGPREHQKRNIILSGYQPPHMFSLEQYRALREGAGLVNRSDRGRLRLTGRDRRDYLQGLLTNDIAALSAGTGCYACLLTAQGRMICDMYIVETGEAIVMDLEAEVTARVGDHFEQFVFSEDVEVADVSGALAQLGVFGPLAADVVGRVLGRAEAVPAVSLADLEGLGVLANRTVAMAWGAGDCRAPR